MKHISKFLIFLLSLTIVNSNLEAERNKYQSNLEYQYSGHILNP